VATIIRAGVIEEAGQRRLTAITHNHDFGIDTVLVPGRPVRIQARIGRHCGSIRGNEGTRRSSAEKVGTKRKGEGGEGGERRGEERRRGRRGGEGERDFEAKQYNGASVSGFAATSKTRSITWNHLFCVSDWLSWLPCLRLLVVTFHNDLSLSTFAIRR